MPSGEHIEGTSGQGTRRAVASALIFRAATLSLLVLAACDPPEPNECGGVAELTFDGEAAAPGNACGACGDGQLVCDGAEALRCNGARELNSCGGCQVLSVEENASCGPCEDGTYQCTAELDLACVGASANNACGGCAILAHAPDDSCQTANGPGVYKCDGTDAVVCDDTGSGACGGLNDPDPLPGTPCGACGLGRNQCDGLNSVACDGETTGVNACGSCGTLNGAPGEACGQCGGELVCHEGGLLCVETGRNRCGGCDVLAASPGDACEGGYYVCTPDGTLSCEPSAQPTNACGGFEPLDTPPGEACGTCGDGWTLCASPEKVVCVDASERNACGGCGSLQGVPGETCAAEGWEWTCTNEGSLSCVDTRAETALGLVLDPETVELRAGETADLIAWLRLSETTREDVTADAIWSTSDEAIATVEQGKITAVAAGPVTIAAEFQGHRAEVALTIEARNPVTVSISLTPNPLVVIKGATATFEAKAQRDDGSEVTVTEYVVWSVANAATATVAGGVVSGVAAGTTTVTATFQDHTTTAQVEVELPPYNVLELAASATSISLNGSTQLTAQATRPGEPTEVVTTRVGWTVAPMGAGTVDAAGRFQPAAVGQATVTATFEGLTDSVAIEVKDPYISLIASTDQASIPLGLTAQVHAFAAREGDPAEEVTTQVQWTVTPLMAGSVDASGVFTPATTGTATLTAQLDGLSATVDIEVREPAPVSLSLRPASLVVERNETATLEAVAQLDNGSERIVTAEASWNSTNTEVATVDAGLVSGIAYGTAEIWASYGGFDASSEVEVPRPPVVSIAIRPGPALSLSRGVCLTFLVEATLENDEVVSVGSEVNWTFSGPSVAPTLSPGGYCVVAVGASGINASLEGKQATVQVTGVSRPADVVAGVPGTVHRRLAVAHVTQGEIGTFHRPAASSFVAHGDIGTFHRPLTVPHVSSGTPLPFNRRTYARDHVVPGSRSHNVTRP